MLLFHLLGRGDSSWCRREAILAQLQRLPAIAAPSHLFQAVLGSEDKEELRDLVAEIGREIRS